MAACPEIVVQPVTLGCYAALIEELRAGGAIFQMSQPYVGSISHGGIETMVNYDPQTLVLRVVCTQKPFWVPCSMIEQRIREAVQYK